ncbi:YggS family pyridoxal phosphate-dependent enzyme [Enterococcus sp.]|uniref:YggS family pyridoxal phosphate-dependent enzyme n=1 Tax=Enterococcus sp. TaxID=35783 RepID=UPI002FCB1B5B
MISDNLRKVRQEIQNSCALVSRKVEEVTLVAVTKSVDSAKMKELYEEDLTVFAENRVDVLLQKQTELADYPAIEWHFIGHLQRRKVKDIINKIDYFHALESLKLAGEIQKRAQKVIRCFVEVNVSGEASKLGIRPEEVLSFIQSLASYDKIEVVGLMMMAPYDSTVEEQRSYFTQLKQLQESVSVKKYSHAPCTELSMGMSNDYPVAIEVGATYVRVGSALFEDE